MNYTEDLTAVCPECNGNGQTPNTKFENDYEKNGSRSLSSFVPFTICAKCARTGQILTESGEAVLNVLKIAKAQNLI